MEVSSQHQALAALSQGKEQAEPFDKWLGGPQSRCGCSGEEKFI